MYTLDGAVNLPGIPIRYQSVRVAEDKGECEEYNSTTTAEVTDDQKGQQQNFSIKI